MGFKMKGSPATTGGIQGTSSHSSALKLKEDDINKLLEKRKKLKEIKERREDKGKGTNRIDRRIKRNQDKIDRDRQKVCRCRRWSRCTIYCDARESIYVDYQKSIIR